MCLWSLTKISYTKLYPKTNSSKNKRPVFSMVSGLDNTVTLVAAQAYHVFPV